MASDSRYIYYAPQDVQNPHPYPPYPAYDAPPQYPPNQARPIRNGVPQPSHSPVQSQPPPNYPPPPNGYPHPGAYVAQAYGPPPPAHWSPDAWQHFPQSFVQASPPIQEQQQYASEARPDVQPHAPPEQRAPADNAPRPASTQPGSSDAQMSPPMALAPPPKPRSAREAHQPPPLAPALSALPLSLPLDFVKLMDSYRLVIDSATALAGDPGESRHASIAEDVDRMLQAAAFGAQALDAAVQRAAEAPPAPPSSDPPAPPEEGDGSGGKPRQVSRTRRLKRLTTHPRAQQKPDAPQEGGQHCLGCKATSTPEWRRGPLGPRTLCNACGLVYAKLVKKRTREPGRARNGAHAKQPRAGLPDALSSGEDGSDRASQGRRSEVPDEGQM